MNLAFICNLALCVGSRYDYGKGSSGIPGTGRMRWTCGFQIIAFGVGHFVSSI